jgi:hypothetical protein
MRQIEELLSREFWRQFLRIIQAAESPMLEENNKKAAATTGPASGPPAPSSSARNRRCTALGRGV